MTAARRGGRARCDLQGHSHVCRPAGDGRRRGGCDRRGPDPGAGSADGRRDRACGAVAGPVACAGGGELWTRVTPTTSVARQAKFRGRGIYLAEPRVVLSSRAWSSPRRGRRSPAMAMADSRTAPEVGNRDHRRRSAPRRDRRYRPARLPRRRDGTTRDARPSDCRCSIPTSATTKFVDEQGEGASPAGACVSRPAASAAAATPTAHAAGIAARVPTRIRLRARPPRGGSPGVRPRTRRVAARPFPALAGRVPPPAPRPTSPTGRTPS